MHGFDEWHSTEASAPSSTTNCGCDPAWWASSPGCVTGGGAWANRSYACTNYWFPTDVDPLSGRPVNGSACRDAASAARAGCVANLTAKVEGDDSSHLVDVFAEFASRHAAAARPFFAQLWLHTNHDPHPALPSTTTTTSPRRG